MGGFIMISFTSKSDNAMSNVVITGASRGIGLETVKKFLNNGWDVVACSRNTSSLEELKLNYPNNLEVLQLDLSDKNSIQSVTTHITNKSKPLDVLIHNAGHLVNKPFQEITEHELATAYWVNTLGPFMLTQQLIPILGQRAHVLAISSMGGFQGSMKFPGLTAYSSSKAAIASLIECLQEEFKGSQQSFNCLCIGAVQTEMLENAFPGYKAPLQPADMAAYIYQFATTAHQFLRGKIIPVSLTNP
jgi:short-subunit dehydrogenase